MGVRDISSIIKKYAASAVTYHPSLASFSGSRFAIDGNLLTTKFFFARANEHPPPPPLDTTSSTSEIDPLGPNAVTAHIIHAWHHLLQTLRHHQIEPIVCFDGLSRLPAKSLENARRRERRAVQRKRGEAERIRGERLALLSQVWDGVEVTNRADVASSFAKVVRDRELSDPDWRTTMAISRPDLVPLPPSPPLEATESAPQLDLSDFPPPPLPPMPDWSQNLPELLKPVDDAKASHPPDPPMTTPLATPPPPPPPPTLPDLAATSHPDVDALLSLYEAHVADTSNPVYSKNQITVTGQERQFYDRILIGGNVDDLVGDIPPTMIPTDSSLQHEAIDVDQERHDEGGRMIEGMLERSLALEASHRHRSQGIPYGVFEEVQRLVEYFGAPVIVPSPLEPHEAEGICAALCEAGLADYVVSEDTDVAIYGAPLLRKVTTKVVSAIAAQDGRSVMNVLDPVKLRDELGFTKNEMVDFALLCGTDFTERLPKIGPVTALKLMRQHRTIESILANYPPLKDADHSAYLESIATARSIFLDPLPLPLDLDLRPRPPSPKLAHYLSEWSATSNPRTDGTTVGDDSVELDDELVAKWAAEGDSFESESAGVDSVELDVSSASEDSSFEQALGEMRIDDEGVKKLAEQWNRGHVE